MRLLNPYAFVLLPLIALLLLAARHRAPRPRRGVSNLYLWRQTKALDPARLALSRFRRHRLLALQIAFIVITVAALARPVVTWRHATSEPAASAATANLSPVAAARRTDPIRVLLLTNGNFFLEQSLLTNPALSVERQRRAGVHYDVVVCDGCGEARSDDSGLLTITPRDGTPSTAEPLIVGNSDHPIGAALVALGTDTLMALPAHRMDTNVIVGDVILRAGSVPVVVSSAGDRGRAVSMNLDLSSSSLPLSTAFPVLMANIIDWLAAREDLSPMMRAETPLAAPGPVPWSATDVRENLSRPLLLAALAILLVEWRLWSLQERSRPALVCRAIVAALIALGAAGLKAPFGAASETVIFALDRSSSLPPQTQADALAQVNSMASRMRAGDRAGLVAFGLDAALERPPSAALHVNDIASTVSPVGTHLEAALRAARAALPHDGARRIVLVSDGRATAGDASGEITRAATEGIRIDAFPADAPAEQRPLILKSVAAPQEARVAEPFLVSVEVSGPPGARAELTIAADDGVPVLTRDIEVAPDGTANVTFTDRRVRAGVYSYRATLDGDDAAASGAVVNITGTPQILYVAASSGPVATVLASAGFGVRHVAPDAMLSLPNALAGYDAVVLDDVMADRLPQSAARAIATFVEQGGGGLLLLGTSESLDVAGYPEGPLGRLLPIDVRPRSGQRAPAMGLVVAFDKSGSMADLVSGVAKIELARQAVRKVLDAVRPSDAIGVVAFDAAPLTVSPLMASPDPRRITERLRAINPGGSTAIAPALAEATDWLHAANVTRRHVLLVSDGRTPPADAAQLREAARRGGFELSVIAIGADADRAFLEELASSTGGRAYFPEDVRQLPMLAAREAARAAGGGIVEERFAVRAASHPIAAGLDRDALPSLGGYIVSALRPGAEHVLFSHLDDPILAAWRFGLGRVAVYTADLQSPWSTGLRHWPGFGNLWLQTARWVGRGATDRKLHATIVEQPEGVRLVVEGDARSGEALRPWDVHAAVRSPSGDTQDVTLTAAGEGRYEASLTTPTAGPYVASITARGVSGSVDARAIIGFYWAANRERRATGADIAALTQIARATGGRLLGRHDNPFDGSRPLAFREIWNALAAAALVLFLVDVALRRGLLSRVRRDAQPASAKAAA